MNVRFAHLTVGRHHIALTSPGSQLGLDERFGSEVKAEVEVERRERDFSIDVVAATRAQCLCDRCLEEFILPVETTFHIDFLQRSHYDDSEDTEDVHYLHGDELDINIGPDVRDALMLAVPLRTICSETCAGIPGDFYDKNNDE